MKVYYAQFQVLFMCLGEFAAAAGAESVRTVTRWTEEGCKRDYEAGGIIKVGEDEWKEGWKRDYEASGISSKSTTRQQAYT